MLAYILAIAVALASLSLYLSAFFLPELHRKDDFLWSGVGLFYALVLWFCAVRITGGVLLGQIAAVALVLSFGWQTVRFRRAFAHSEAQTDLTGFSVIGWLQNRLDKKKPAVPPLEPPITPTEETVTEVSPVEAATIIVEVDEPTASEETPSVEVPLNPNPEEIIEASTQAEDSQPTPTPPTSEAKKGFSLRNLFGGAKAKPQPPTTTINEALDEAELETEAWETTTETETPAVAQEAALEDEVKIEIEVVEKYELELEAFADDDTETLIESYQPKRKTAPETNNEPTPDSAESVEVESSQTPEIKTTDSEESERSQP